MKDRKCIKTEKLTITIVRHTWQDGGRTTHTTKRGDGILLAKLYSAALRFFEDIMEAARDDLEVRRKSEFRSYTD